MPRRQPPFVTLVVGVAVVAQSAKPAAAVPGLPNLPSLFAGTSLANKTAAALAKLNARDRKIVAELASLGAKPNDTVLALEAGKLKNSTRGTAATALHDAKVAASVALAGKSGAAPTRPDEQLVGGLQSAQQAAGAAIKLAHQYLTGGRVMDDIKNATIKADLKAFEAARLEEEAGWLSGTNPSFIQLDTVPASAAAATPADITCYVDPALGVVTNVRQGAIAACTAGGDLVVLPTAGKYITKIELAIDKQLPFVGRLTVHARASPTAKPVVHTCGWGGGDAVSLFPSGNVAVRLDVGCMPLTVADLGRRRRRRRLHQLAADTVHAANLDLIRAAVVASSVAASPPSITVAPTNVSRPPPFKRVGAAVEGAVAAILSHPPACADASVCAAPRFVRPPSAPTVFTPRSLARGALVVPFAASTDPGAPPVAAYTVKCVGVRDPRSPQPRVPACGETGANVFTQTVAAGASPLLASFTDLPNNDYVCFVLANNGIDGDVCSAPSAAVAVLAPPSAPSMGPVSSPASGVIVVQFSQPVDVGTPPVANYTVRCVDAATQPAPTCATAGPSVVVPAQSDLVATLTGLTGGTAYVCYATSNNGIGSDACSDPSAAVVVTTRLPSAPAAPTAASSSVGALTVAFTGSSDAGVPAVVKYTVKCVRERTGGVILPSCDDVSQGAFWADVTPAATSYTFASLPGDNYACFVIADNGAGGTMCSPRSASTGVAAPPTAPSVDDAPTSPGAGQLVVPFQKSLERGFPVIANYTVKCLAESVAPACSAVGTGVFSQVVDAAALPRQASFAGLPGGLYSCFAVASNGVGTDQCSQLSYNAVVPQLPTAPTVLAPSSPAPGRIVVPFSASSSAGYPPLATYVVRCVPSTMPSTSCTSTGEGVVETTLPASTSPLQAVLDGATQGAMYQCYAAARNDALGVDVCSAASPAITVIGRLPSAPGIGLPSSAGVGLLQVPFNASVDPGVPAVASYQVKCVAVAAVPSPTCDSTGAGVYLSPSISPAGGPQLSALFTNLPGGSYVCFSSAQNGVGGTTCSPASASTLVPAPPTQPGTPIAVAVDPPGTLAVTFEASADLGAPAITAYTVRCVAGAQPACGAAGPSVSVPASGASPLTGTLTGLAASTSFTCFVVVSNGVGGDICSPPSNTVLIPTVLPSAPAVTSAASAAPNTLDVAFTGSTVAGNPPLAQYVVQCVRWSSATPPTCLIIGGSVFTRTVALTANPLQASFSGLPGASYVCFVYADNGAGGQTCSPAAPAVAVTAAPTAPVVGAPRGSNNTITVPFTASSSLGYPRLTSYTVKCAAITNPNAPPPCSASGAGVYSTTVAASAVPLQAVLTGVPLTSSYICYAVADNGVGSACSSGVNVLLSRPPLPPTNVTATSPITGHLDVVFAPSTDLGQPSATAYTVVCAPYTTPFNHPCSATVPGDVSVQVAAGATPTAHFAGLEGGAQYACFVLVGNSVGGDVCSVAGDAVTVTPWRLAVTFDVATFVSSDAGQSWKFSPHPGLGITSSSDGSVLAFAGVNGGNVYKSTDYGASFATKAPPYGKFYRVAMSADGSIVAAAIWGGGIWYSDGSYGKTWLKSDARSANWHGLAASADGAVMAATIDGDRIWVSTTHGRTWRETYTPQADWRGIALSATGDVMVAVATDLIMYSHDRGMSWGPGHSSRGRLEPEWIYFWAVATSADGSKMVAVGGHPDVGGAYNIYTSVDSGLSWQVTSAPVNNYNGVASSADGSILAASHARFYPAGIIMSYDSGATWVNSSAPPSLEYRGISMSADGTKLAACQDGGPVWVSNSSGRSWQPMASMSFDQKFRYEDIAMSANGSQLATVYYGSEGYVWLTYDAFNGPWVTPGGPYNRNCHGLTSSSDATKMAATNLIRSGSQGRISVSYDQGLTWRESNAPLNYWHAITSSADMSRLATVADRGGKSRVTTSTDYGLNWFETGSRYARWSAVASSADGSFLAACIWGDRIWTSQDGGTTWRESNAPQKNWAAIAGSADMSVQLAAVIDFNPPAFQRIYVSYDRGKTFTETPPSPSPLGTSLWTSVAVSSDGRWMAAVTSGRDNTKYLITSSDGGRNWVQRPLPTSSKDSVLRPSMAATA